MSILYRKQSSSGPSMNIEGRLWSYLHTMWKKKHFLLTASHLFLVNLQNRQTTLSCCIAFQSSSILAPMQTSHGCNFEAIHLM